MLRTHSNNKKIKYQNIMRKINCIICGSSRYNTLFQKGPFRVVKCLECSLVYASPRLDDEEIKKLYTDNYFNSREARSIGYTDYFSQYNNYRRTFAKRMNVIERYKKTGN